MIAVRVILQLHHGHELEAIIPWAGEALPSPGDVVIAMEERGGLKGWRVNAMGETVEAEFRWDPREAVSMVTELTTLSIEAPTEVACSCGNKDVVMGLECSVCGDVVSGEPPQ